MEATWQKLVKTQILACFRLPLVSVSHLAFNSASNTLGTICCPYDVTIDINENFIEYLNSAFFTKFQLNLKSLSRDTELVRIPFYRTLTNKNVAMAIVHHFSLQYYQLKWHLLCVNLVSLNGLYRLVFVHQRKFSLLPFLLSLPSPSLQG